MREREIPKPGEFYRHFKNRYYQIIAVATHSETREQMVVYQALYDDFGIYVRPLDMFLSEVDKKKYPDIIQRYRFECVERPGVLRAPSECSDTKTADMEPAEEQAERFVPDEEVERFLDADTYRDKLSILMSLGDHITDKQLHDMAITLDITIEDGDVREKYQNLVQCLRTMARFEMKR